MDSHGPATDLLESFRRARRAAESHMRSNEDAGETWNETTITDIILQHARPFVKSAKFNQNQEGITGADWVWWWLDDAGEAFGMLVQAKRLRIGTKWAIDFPYPGDWRQYKNLSATAAELDLAPTYALYLGTQQYRAPVTCRSSAHVEDDCERCAMEAVSLLLALLGTIGGGFDQTDGEAAYRASRPLESFADAGTHVDLSLELHLDRVDPELRSFLLEPQHGARQIAKMLFDRVAEARKGQFSLATEERITTDAQQIFTEYPLDRGHFGAPYYPNILRGLRRTPPAYVMDALAGFELPEEITKNTAGIVVIQL